MNGTGKNDNISAKSVPQSRSARSVPLADIERRREAEQINHDIYFLYGCDRIKIGTSRNANRRIFADIAPYSPCPLVVLGTIQGGTIAEARLHRRFKEYEIGNEWFYLGSDLRAFLCEYESMARRLEEAERIYLKWLRIELAHMEASNESPPNKPRGGARRSIPLDGRGEETRIVYLAHEPGQLSRRRA